MKLGYPNNPLRDPVAEIEWIATSGFGFVDLFLEPDRAAVENIDPPEIRDALDRHGLDRVGHMAYYLPIGSPLPQLRQAAIDTATVYLKAFSEIGVPAATIHANWPPSFFPADRGVAWQIDSLRKLTAIGADVGVRIMYEPVDSRLDAPEQIEQILSAVPDLLCHLDLGHCNLHGRTPAKMIKTFGNRLHHVHLHDNNGLADLHLPPGTGNINWPSVAKALEQVGYDRTVTLEVFSRDREYVLLAKRRVEKHLASLMK